MTQLVHICIPGTKKPFYIYKTTDIVPERGARVQVPFQKKHRIGFMLECITKTHIAPEKIREITLIIDEKPYIDSSLWDLYHFVSTYYHASLSEVLRLALPKQFRAGIPLTHTPGPADSKTCNPPLALHPEQEHAVHSILSGSEKYNCFLLDGVTGSGKTEVYLHIITHMLAQKKQILVLVPEIGLTPQLLQRFQKRLQAHIAIMHSQCTEKNRHHVWQAAYFGEADIIIGTRTAVFTPMPRLGLIIIDEEHDASFKQQNSVRYSAKDTALIRAWQANIPIVLGSATPSLETLYNVQKQKVIPLFLHHKASASHPLHIQVCDLRNQTLYHGFAQCTLDRIQDHLDKQQQVLVFLNRRGYAPVLLCHHCGWMCDCPACDTHLTLHHQGSELICHHCGLTFRKPTFCKQCHSQELIPIGTGTQRLHDYLLQQFPKHRTLRIDRDTIKSKKCLDTALKTIATRQTDIIIGTQMIAKGHHFPHLTLAVIIDVDGGLHHPDFRAIERLGQLVTQVTGRAGRAHLPGEMIIQTHLPEHPLLNLLLQRGYAAFAQALLQDRIHSKMPPVHHIALFQADDKKKARLECFMISVKAFLQQQVPDGSCQIMGPAPAPMARKAHYYRMQLLLKSAQRKILQTTLTNLQHWLTINKTDHAMRWHIDVDPLDLS